MQSLPHENLKDDVADEWFDHVMSDYKQFVDRGVKLLYDDERERLGLGALGMVCEAGEAGDILKKHIFHGVELDRDGLVKELGDVLWYFTLILNTTGITLDEVVDKNVDKLVSRYPDNHSA